MLAALASLGLTLNSGADIGSGETEASARLLARLTAGDLDPRAAALIAGHQHRRARRAATLAAAATAAAPPAMGDLPLEGAPVRSSASA